MLADVSHTIPAVLSQGLEHSHWPLRHPLLHAGHLGDILVHGHEPGMLLPRLGSLRHKVGNVRASGADNAQISQI
jgi:hypothetical protein